MFTSNGEGTITIIHEDAPSKFRVVETVTTRPGARSLTIDPQTSALFLPTAEFGAPPEPPEEVPAPKTPIVPNTFVTSRVTR